MSIVTPQRGRIKQLNSKWRSVSIWLSWTAVFVTFATLAYGQAITGRLVGTVFDPSGAVVLDAEITVTNPGTGFTRTLRSDGQGNYVAPALSPGSYRVTVAAPGFRTAIASDNVVRIDQSTRVDFHLETGALTETVDVTASAPLVASTSSEVGQVIGREEIVRLPLNGRLFSQLITLAPGAVQRGFTDFGENPAGAGARAPTNASVNGMPWSGNNFTLDGVANNEPLNQFISVSPPLEAIQEFKIQTNNPRAEFGVFGGAVVNLTMRSGTNEYHGSLFEYLRNDELNARSFFAAERAPFKANQFGGTIGGPIVKDRLFFFADYQGTRLRNGRTFVFTVPTAALRNGDFSGSGATIYDPQTGQPFANNQIPESRFDPVTAQVRNLWPTPNRPGTSNNFVANASEKADSDQVDYRVDYTAGPASLFLRHSYAQREVDAPTVFNEFVSTGNVNSDSDNHNAVFGYTHTFSPTFLNEFRFGYNRFDVSHFGDDFGIAKNNELGILNGNVDGFPETFGIANFSVPGYQGFGSPGWTNAERIASTYQITDNTTWVRGKHTFKLGGDARLIYSTLTNPEGPPRGNFSFNSNFTSNQGAAGTGDGLASFLLGLPTQVDRSFLATRPGVEMTFAGFYAQDDIRLTPNLSLNLGLRWDIFTHPREKFNRQTNFNPDTLKIESAQDGNRGPNIDTFKNSWGPRAGIAYSPDDGRTALRAAFGVSYFADNFGATGGTLERNFPLFPVFSASATNTFTPFRTVSGEGLQPAAFGPLQPSIDVPPGITLLWVPRDFRQVQTTMWNFGVQRQITPSSVVDISYVGTSGAHLYRTRNINTPLTPGPGNIDSRRPFAELPGTQNIVQRGWPGSSSYNALQVKYDKRFSGGLQALVSYTYSKSIDNVSNVIWPWDDSLNRGLSAGFKQVDIPHNLAVSYSYELPFARDAGSAWARHIAGGWTLNGITTIQSGAPLVVNVASSQLNTGTGNRANITCTDVDRPRVVGQWFNTGCFAAPAAFEFGNSGVGHVRGPGIVNFDVSAFKRFNFTERTSLEFRAEAFNVFNNAHFDNPGTSLGSANFGVISNTILTPREMQVGLVLRF